MNMDIAYDSENGMGNSNRDRSSSVTKGGAGSGRKPGSKNKNPTHRKPSASHKPHKPRAPRSPHPRISRKK